MARGGGRARGFAGRLRDPRPRSRHRHRRLDRTRRVGRLGVRPLALRPAELPRAAPGAGAGDLVDRRGVAMVGSARARGRAARPVRLGGGADHRRPTGRGAGEADPLPADVRGKGGTGESPPVRVGARRLHRRVQRPADRRRGARAGLDQLPPPAPLPDPRRHRPARRRCQRARRLARRRLVPRATRVRRRACGTSTAPTSALLAQLEIALRRRIGRRRRRPTARWRSGTRPPSRHRPLRGRDLRRPPGRSDGWSTARPSTTADWVDVGDARTRLGHVMVAPTRSAGAQRSTTLRPATIAHVTVRRDASSTSARTSPGGCGSGSAARPATRSRCATPRCSSTASSARGRCAAPKRPTRTCSPATGPEQWEPTFTMHGFRYVQVEGWPGELDAGRRSTRSSATPTWNRPAGSTRRRPVLDRLHDNVRWSMRGNFVDLPTDCPQRDERLGWTGDIQVFAPTRRASSTTAPAS